MLTSACSAEVDHEAKVVRCVHVSCHVTSFRILWRGWQNIKVMHFKESPLPCSVAGAALLVCVHTWALSGTTNAEQRTCKILNWMCRNVDQLHRGVVWRLDTMPAILQPWISMRNLYSCLSICIWQWNGGPAYRTSQIFFIFTCGQILESRSMDDRSLAI